RSRGWEAIVVVPRDGDLAARVRAAGASVEILPMPATLAGFGEWSLRGASDFARRVDALVGGARSIIGSRGDLRRVLARVAPDLVHTNGFKLHVLGARAVRRGTPLVWHIHEYVGQRPLSRTLLRHHASRASAIVANSQSVAADVREAIAPAAPV